MNVITENKYLHPRIRIFEDFLNRYNLDSIIIPSKVYDDIRSHLSFPINIKNLSYNQLLQIIKILLKLCNHRSYYENIVQIAYDLFGIYPFDFMISNRRTLIDMYDDIWKTIHRVIKYRISIGFYYIFYKMLELVINDEKLNYFKKPINSTLHKNDKIWKEICSGLNWLFIPSFNITDDLIIDNIKIPFNTIHIEIIKIFKKIYNIIKEKSFIIDDSFLIFKNICKIYNLNNYNIEEIITAYSKEQQTIINMELQIIINILNKKKFKYISFYDIYFE